MSAPLTVEGWSIERIRNAIALHDQGFFLESSMLAVIISRFGPVFAALSQAIAPALALPRYVNGGTRGLSRLLREEVEADLAPRKGLMPSQYFPPTLWGSMSLDLVQSGFSVLQHVFGDEDDETGVRPLYTRRWPTWATQYYPYRRTYVAITTEGPIDIVSGDGKFTIVGDTETPHLNGAIRAAGLEVLDGTLAKQARASYIDRYGNPKWIGIMPDKTPVHGPEGDAMFDAMETIQGPDGWGVIPHGADYKTAQMTSAQGSVFKDALDNIWQYIAAIYLGSDGTMSKGSEGVYTAPVFAGVRRDIVDRMLKSEVRGANQGHVRTYLVFNYAASIAAAPSFVEPVLDIPLPDPDADARIKSYAERSAALVTQIKLERENGFPPTQERVEQLAKAFDVDAPTLGSIGPISDVALSLKQIAPDEYRATLGLGPMPNSIGTLAQLAEERRTGKDQVSGKGIVDFDPANADAYTKLAGSVGLQPSAAGVAAILLRSGLGSQPIPEGFATAPTIGLADASKGKVVKVDEARAELGLPIVGGTRGDEFIAEIAPAGGGEPAVPGGHPAPEGDPAGVNDGSTNQQEPA